MHDSMGMVITKLLLAFLLAQSPTPAVWPPQNAPVQMREIFWGGRHGALHHRPMGFIGERPVEGADFYRAVGRNDLAAEYEQRESNGHLTVGAGVVVMVLGLFGLAAASSDRTSCSAFESNCQPTTNDPGLAAAGITGLVVGTVAVAGASQSPDPLSDDERRALAEAHNRRLNAQPPAPTFTPAPALAPHAAFLGVRGRF